MRSSLMWLVSVIAAAALILIFFTAVGGFARVRDKRMEAAVKLNAHTIQLAVERYAINNNGEFPAFLIGGDGNYAPGFNSSKANHKTMKALGRGKGVLSSKSPLDPLLSGGYLQSYPRNPFIKDALAVASLQSEAGDPLRNDGKGAIFRTRFGASCTLMGNVMPDHRFPSGAKPIIGVNVLPAEIEGVDFQGYPMYDFGNLAKPDYYLPGMFFYKSSGPNILSSSSIDWSLVPVRPIEYDYYALGVFGGRSNKGYDFFGPAVFEATANDGTKLEVPMPSQAWLLEVPYYLQARYKDSPEILQQLQAKVQGGCMFKGDGWAGNPNGISDGIIVILESSERPLRDSEGNWTGQKVP